VLTLSSTVLQLRKPIIPNSILGMGIFITTEIMFFTGLISAYLVIKKDRITWALPNNIQLPVETTALNTLALLASGWLMFIAGKKMAMGDQASTQSWVIKALLLGIVFVVIQGVEWVQLASYGLTMNNSIFGALFFLIIGCHGLHVIAGLVVLLVTIRSLNRGQMKVSDFRAMQMFWFLVVGIWPLLYFLVYF